MAWDEDKAAWRRAALARRRGTTPRERLEAGERVARALAAAWDETIGGAAPGTSAMEPQPAGMEPRPGTMPGTAGMPAPSPAVPPTVAAYVSMGTEVETRPLLRLLLARGCRVLLPRLGDGLDVGWGALEAAGESDGADGTDGAAARAMASLTEVGARRPQEPDGPLLPPRALEQARCVLVPALAVDRTGARLGRGGGWYDRALAWRRPGAPVLAVCWPWELAAGGVPVEAHDRPVDGALVPGGLVWLGDRRR